MRNKIFSVIILSSLFITTALSSLAEGISVDAGLTPGQDRIIVRLQYRNITNWMGDDKMVMHMMPIVLVYGLTPDVTLMMRNGYRAAGTNETMMEMNNQWMDPFFMGKVKLYRLNTRTYSVGVAGFAGTTFPILNSSVSKSFNPVIGLNASFRPGFWSFDLNNAYEWVDYNTEDKNAAAQQLQLNLAISRNIILPGIENWILAPVQEFSFVNNNPASGNTGSYGFISPGFQLVSPNLKFESLYQIPVNSSKTAMDFGGRLIVGLRFMF